MAAYDQKGVTHYDDITSTTPVGKIVKITNTNPAKIYFGSDWHKFHKGDLVYITRQDKAQGYELFDMQAFILDNPNEKDGNFFLKRPSDNKTIDASGILGEIKNGFAQIKAAAPEVVVEPQKVAARKAEPEEEPEPSSRKDAKEPARDR